MSDIEEAMKIARAPSISVGVLHNGEVLLRKSVGLRDVEAKLPANSDTAYLIGSCSKMFTSTALSLLVEDKKVSWKDTIRTHLPTFSPIGDPQIGEKATLMDAARHSTGLANPNAVCMGPEGTIPNTAQDHISLVNALPTWNAHGQRFRSWWYYSNAAFGLLSQVIEAVACTSFSDFLRRRILEPLDLQQTLVHEADVERNSNLAHPYAQQADGTWARIKTGITSEKHSPVLSGVGMRSSVNDMLAFLVAVMNRYDEENGTEPRQPLLGSKTENPLRRIGRLWSAYWQRPVDDGFQNETVYLLGWYRTTMPTAALGVVTVNEYAHPKESGMKEVIGRDSGPRTLYGNNGIVNGSVATAYVFPESHTAIVALSNAADACDVAEVSARILLQALFDLQPHVDMLQALNDVKDRRLRKFANMVADWQRDRDSDQYTGRPDEFLGTYIGLNTSRIDIVRSETAPAKVAVLFGGHASSQCDLEPYNLDALSFLPLEHDQWLARGMLDWDSYKVGILEFVRDKQRSVIALWWQWDQYDYPGLWVKKSEEMNQQDINGVVEKLGRFRL